MKKQSFKPSKLKQFIHAKPGEHAAVSARVFSVKSNVVQTSPSV